MRLIIALAVILMFAGVGGFFAWFAFAIRRDFRERFQRIEQQLENEADRVIGNLFSRRHLTTSVRLSDRPAHIPGT